MIGTGGPRMLRLTAELADEWNAGMQLPDELPPLIARVDAACAAVGRDPATLPRSAEALIRTIDAAGRRPAEEREIRGSPAELAAALRRYGELGMAHVQVQLRPNRVEAVEAFRAGDRRRSRPRPRSDADPGPRSGGAASAARAGDEVARAARPAGPSASKFSGRSHASYARAQRRPLAVEDREPRGVAAAALVTAACRKIPSNWNPSRAAAARDGAFRESHFHS